MDFKVRKFKFGGKSMLKRGENMVLVGKNGFTCTWRANNDDTEGFDPAGFFIFVDDLIDI